MAAGDLLESLTEDRLRQDGRRGRPIASHIAGLAGDFPDHLRTHILEGIFELDFFGDGDAVFRRGRRTEFLIEDDIATARAQGHFDRIGQLIDTTQHVTTGFFTEV